MMTNQVDKRNAVNFLKSLATATILAPIFMWNNSAKAVTFDFESGLPLIPEVSYLQQLGIPPSTEFNFDFIPTIQTLSDGNNVLRLSDGLTALENGAFTTTFLYSETFDNVKVSALLNPAGPEDGDEGTNDRLLLFARVNPENSDAYVFGIDFEANQIFLREVVGGNILNIFVEETVELDGKLPYLAEFTVIGNQLTGRLFDETGTQQLSKVSFFDTENPLSAGITGIATDISNSIEPLGNDKNNVTIDNFSVSSVPEPSSILGLLVVGAMGAGSMLKRK